MDLRRILQQYLNHIPDRQISTLVDQVREYINPDELCIQRRFKIPDVVAVLNDLKCAKPATP